jgi:hypothetical protein
MDKDEPKTSITWSANEEYLRDFAMYFIKAQMLFPLSRRDNKLLTHLFDHIHEVYRMELPYCDKKERDELNTKHDDIRKRVENYLAQTDGYRRDNFGKLFYMLDNFFTRLTDVAVEKKFFPIASKSRTIKDLTGTLKLR